MQRYAVVDPDRAEILRYIEPGDAVILPIVETSAEVGENQILGPVIETIERDRVVAHRAAVRALSGLVAVLNQDGTVHSVKDLGPELVAVGSHVLPLEDVSPPLGEGERYGEVSYEVLDDSVLQMRAVEEIPPEPLPDLQPYQFRAMLKLSGREADLLSFIAGLEEPARSVASAKLEYTLVFRRDHDLVEQARQALGMSSDELDDLWGQAAAIA
jgi:hypothetical protein